MVGGVVTLMRHTHVDLLVTYYYDLISKAVWLGDGEWSL